MCSSDLIPDLSPHALAVVRIAYGLAMMRVVLRSQVASMPLEVQRLESWLARTTVIRDISASTTGPASLRFALVCALGLFAAGVVPRVALAISAALLLVLTSVLVTHQSTHDLALPMVVMWLKDRAARNAGV